MSSARSLCHRVRRYPRGLDDDCGRGWRRRPATVARRRSPSLLPSSILKQNLYSIRAEMMRKESPWLGLRIVYLSLGNGRRIKANQASFFSFFSYVGLFSYYTAQRKFIAIQEFLFPARCERFPFLAPSWLALSSVSCRPAISLSWSTVSPIGHKRERKKKLGEGIFMTIAFGDTLHLCSFSNLTCFEAAAILSLTFFCSSFKVLDRFSWSAF